MEEILEEIEEEQKELPYYFLVQNDRITGKSRLYVENEEVINIEVSEEVYNDDIEKYIYDDGEIVLDPDYEEKQKQKRKATFEKEFFQTSLGWIRRAVNMADGSTKDFLSDLLPTISMAVQMGTPVKIIAYDEPDFTEEITDWTPYQHVEVVTAQFIQECFTQLSNDFLPINEDE